MYRFVWAREKRALAARLAAGAPNSGYPEAVLILCAAISGLASDAWPGRASDRARFVEALKEFVPPRLKVVHISIPLLVGTLRSQGDLRREAELLAREFDAFQASRILTSSDVDQPESNVVAVCPKLDLRTVRSHCYASLLYRELRSAYTHEYRSGPNAGEHPMTSVKSEAASYINVVGRRSRQIHFHLEWIGDIAVALAKSMDAAQESLPRRRPTKWWLEG